MKKRILLILTWMLLALAIPAVPVFAQNTALTWIAFVGNDGNIYLTRPDGSQLTPLTADASPMAATHPPPDFLEYARPIWSPDGQKLSFIRRTGHYDTSANRLITVEFVVVYDLHSRTMRSVAENLGQYAWSPDSSALVYGKANQWGATRGGGWQQPPNGIWKLDLASGQTVEVVKPQGVNPLTRPQFSPDGRYLSFDIPIYMEGLGYFGYYDLQQNAYHTWESEGQEVGLYSWAHDSSFIIFDRNTYVPQPGNQLWRAGAQLENPQVISPKADNYAFYQPLVSPDSKFIACFGAVLQVPEEKYTLWVMNNDGSESRVVLIATAPEQLFSFAWSPDSRSLVTASGIWEQQIIRVVDAGTAQKVKLAEGREPAWQPASVETPLLQPTTSAPAATAVVVSTAEVLIPTDAPAAAPTPTPTKADQAAPSIISGGMGVTSTLVIGGLCLSGIVVVALVIVFVVLPGRRKNP